MTNKSRCISTEELSKHDNHKNCWIALHGIVFDITPFLNEHPGGPDVIVSVSGKDCTAEFEDVGHTDSARRMGDKYIIGKHEGGEDNDELRLPTAKEVHDRSAGAKSSGSMGAFALGTFFVAAAAALYHAFSSHK
jgi:cytochrome b involved in lipid metabolism